MSWQAIETAPKDGTFILLKGGQNYSFDPIGPAVVAFWDETIYEWAYCFWDGAWRSAYVDPTHWMPVPE